ncbi:CPCC family cysteine-rich protein [Yinghuangia seranimata]|uniref:CPCC family cysteine-rich protein n=1 Tax=Yinghuangia seranimata TaxID=408067 RepID=UPI00248CFB7D|nr:CPCC family cysteine-rich protein [Yinghuangia seranimata]MDI2130828.1 CPCC family cysteine-rich protein [Yinghuangia seranimata]
MDGGPYPCPCCRLMTLESFACFEICPECGWEDDGQDDSNADQVLGGPNGSMSLTQAREEYEAFIADGVGPDSVSRGGVGSWWAAAKRFMDEQPQ